MAKIKCKKCKKSWKANSKKEFDEVVDCKKTGCPILCPKNKEPEKKVREEVLLDFSEYQLKEFSTVSKFGTESSDEFGGWM